jgi:RNA polymerase sigma-70 factor, ECF subfamily
MSIGATEGSIVTDDETLARDAARESGAFAELYARYLFPVHRYVRSQVPDAATAEDLTAQIFYKSLISARTFRGEGSYRAWIFRIARNTIATWRTQRSNAEIPVGEIDEDLASSGDLSLVTLEDDEVTATVDDLPDAQREVILLRYWNDLTVDEIAATTRRSPGAVRQLLHRARARLRKNLSGADITALAGATGASAFAIYSIARRKRHR